MTPLEWFTLRAVAAIMLLTAGVGVAGAQPPRPSRTSARAAAPTVEARLPDSIKVDVEGVRDPVTVRLPTVTTRPSRDWIDWLGLIGSILVAPVAALIAALLGAKIGGEGARRAAIEVQQREAADARRLRAEERRDNEVRERWSLLRRLERDVTMASGIAEGLRVGQEIRRVMPASAANLRAMWDSFVLRRDAVMLLADPELEHEVQFFYEWTLSRSANLETWLENERTLFSTPTPNMAEIHRRASKAEQDVQAHVERGLAALPRVKSRVEQLATQVMGGTAMLTRQKLDAIHDALDNATTAVGDASDALVAANVAATAEAVRRANVELGKLKEELRGVAPDR